MNNNKNVGVIVGIAAVAIVVAVAYNIVIMDNSTSIKDHDINGEDEEVWNTAGAFGINKHVYKLGEDIFFAGRMAPDQQVLVRVANPEGKIIIEKYYNGIDRELVKFYFKPDTSASKGIYSKDEIIGKWMIWFEGISNDVIYFDIIDEFVPGTEDDIQDLRSPEEIAAAEREKELQSMITVERPEQ